MQRLRSNVPTVYIGHVRENAVPIQLVLFNDVSVNGQIGTSLGADTVRQRQAQFLKLHTWLFSQIYNL